MKGCFLLDERHKIMESDHGMVWEGTSKLSSFHRQGCCSLDQVMMLLRIPKALQQGDSSRADTRPGTCSCGSSLGAPAVPSAGRAPAVTPLPLPGDGSCHRIHIPLLPAPRSPSTCPSPFIGSLVSYSGTAESQRHICHSTSTPSHSSALLSIPACSTPVSWLPFPRNFLPGTRW